MNATVLQIQTKSDENKISEYLTIKREIEALEAKLSEIRGELEASLDAQGTDKIITKCGTVSRSIFESTRFDQAEFKSVHPDLFSAFSKKSSTIRFQVK